MKTIVEKLFENAELYPDKLALVFENEEVTYAQLQAAAIRLASWFKQQGIQKGDRIVVQAAYCKWFAAACYAAHLCGAIVVPVEKVLAEETLKSTVERLEARAVLSEFSSIAQVSLNYKDIDAKLDGVKELTCEFPDLELEANIMLTSGTTGSPKGAVLTQRNIAEVCVTMLHETDMDIKKDDVGITMMPLNHVGSMRRWQTAHYNGSTYILLDGIIKISKFFEFMRRYQVSSFYMAPSGVAALEKMSRDKLHEFADQIDYVQLGAALLQTPQRLFLERMLPYSRLVNIYGSTENGTATIHRFDRDKKDVSCVGKPCNGVDIKILDDSMHEIKSGDQGRVVIKTDMNCKGYWGLPELSEEVYSDGYFLTNDIGYFDEDGFLYVLGRVDDVINVGGLKLFPSEVEKAAMGIAGIAECLCYGIPNSVTGNSVKLLVRLADGSDLSIKDIRTALMTGLDNYKVPAEIEIVSEIVKNPNGKPDRKYYCLRDKEKKR